MVKKKAATHGGTKEDGKVVAILAYLLVGIIWWLADEKMKKNEFAKYHVKQGLVLFITWVIVGIIWNILPWGLYWIISLLQLALVVLLILGIINAANGQEKEMPVIGQFAKKFTF